MVKNYQFKPPPGKVFVRAGQKYKGKVLTSEQAKKLGNLIDIKDSERGQKALKAIQEYEALIERDLAKGDLSKTPSWARWVRTKYGKVAGEAIEKAVNASAAAGGKEFYNPSVAEARDTLTKRLVEKANQGEKFVEMQTVLEKVGVDKKDPNVKTERVRGDLFEKYRPLLEKKEDKVRKVFDNIVEADDVIEWPEKSTKYTKFAKTPLTAMIAERTGVSNNQWIETVLAGGESKGKSFAKQGIYKSKHPYDKKLLNLAGRTGVIEFGKPFSEIIEDAKYRAGGGVQWSKKVIRPDTAETINSFALRHWNQHKRNKTGKSQIEFYYKNTGKPVNWETVTKNKYGQKSLKGDDVFFRYTKDPLQRKWDRNLLRTKGRQSQLFKEVYDAKKAYNKLLTQKVPDPRNPNRTIVFEDLMRKTYKKGYDQLGNVFAIDHEKLVANKPFNALRIASTRLNHQLDYISRRVKQKNFKKILMDSLDLTQLDDPLKGGQELAEQVLVEGYKNPLTASQELGQKVLKKDLDKLSRPMVNQLVNLFSVSTNEELVKPILDAANLPGAQICNVVFGKGKRFGTVAGGPPGGCPKEMAQALNENPDEVFKKVADAKQKGGALGRASNWAKNILNKVPKGGRLGAILGGAGAVGGGAYALLAGEEAQADTMKYNPTTGEFDNAEGEPETQEGILNWIADNPIKSGLAPIPALLGASLFASAKDFTKTGKALTSFPALVAPALAAEKLYQYKEGVDPISMATDPLNVIFAAGWETKASAKAKEAFYKDPKNQRLFQMKNLKNPRNIPGALRSAVMSPRAGGTQLMFGLRAGKELAPSGLARLGGMALRATPIGWGIGALSAANYGWNKYKDVRDTNSILDSMREHGNISEEDADTLRTIMKQGWLGTTSLGAKILGSEELELGGQMVGLDQQKQILNNLLEDVDEFQSGREDVRAKDRQQEFFSWFSDGGRVGMKTGGMDRRSFLKWIAGLAATATGLIKGKGLTTKAPVAKAVPKAIAKFQGVEGMPMWFPRAVAKIKAHGKLISMADKHYVDGDIYEMMIPVTRRYMDAHAKRKGGENVYITKNEYEKVTMSENPLTGEVSMSWTGTDNWGDDAVRQINFKPGEAGYQKFGVDPDHPGAWEYQRVKVDEPEFTYTQPDQSQPYRDDIEYLDIFDDGDEIVAGLEKMTGGKNMVMKDGSVVDVSDYSKTDKEVDEAFKKKIYRDIEGEDALLPDPEGHMTPDGWQGEGTPEFIEGEVPDWVPKDEWPKKAAGGIIETGQIARRPGAVPPLSGPASDGIMSLYSNPKQVNVG